MLNQASVKRIKAFAFQVLRHVDPLAPLAEREHSAHTKLIGNIVLASFPLNLSHCVAFV